MAVHERLWLPEGCMAVDERYMWLAGYRKDSRKQKDIEANLMDIFCKNEGNDINCEKSLI